MLIVFFWDYSIFFCIAEWFGIWGRSVALGAISRGKSMFEVTCFHSVVGFVTVGAYHWTFIWSPPSSTTSVIRIVSIKNNVSGGEWRRRCNFLLYNHGIGATDGCKRIKKVDLSTDIVVIIIQTLEKTRSILHVLVTPKNFGQITYAGDDARIKKCWVKILKLIPKNLHICEIMRKRMIILFDKVKVS